MTSVLLWLVVLWLLALTLVFASLLRQVIGVVKHGIAGHAVHRIDRWLPVDAVAVLERAGVTETEFTAVIFAAGCTRCVKQARLIAPEDVDPVRTVFFIAGPPGDGVDELRDLLAPTGARLVYDPAALNLVKALGVDDTPFAFVASAGEVIAQAHLGRQGTFRDFAAPIGKQPAAQERR